MLPGPTMRSTLGTVAVPNASAAMACAPPIRKTLSTPKNSAAARISALGCGEAPQKAPAALPPPLQCGRPPRFSLRQTYGFSRDETLRFAEWNDSEHHITILFNGY